MKRDLYFSKPLINAAGSLGFVPDFRSLGDFGSLGQLGAFVTNPISFRPRLPTSRPAVIEFPGGFLMHTGLPNPGFHAALKKYSARWNRADIPIIVHLMADRPEETQKMTRELETVENVMAVQLGFAPLLADDIILLNLEMCLGEIPLIFVLPHEQVLTLGRQLADGGASAISIAAPRGALRDKNGNLVTGRMYGQALFPRSLDILRSAAMIGLPVIGSGGVWSRADVESMLEAGAIAVETDARLWVPEEALSKGRKKPEGGSGG
ncbi:MAG: Dihydroorotate dehydrogenase B (NAD(+)), catalytic subunit [Anaerolineales bacterium]|nr:Dihydroorotate dehydrogenase B (NAD(+)), catalytic subunit [Anaerolineales bacterium]